MPICESSSLSRLHLIDDEASRSWHVVREEELSFDVHCSIFTERLR